MSYPTFLEGDEERNSCASVCHLVLPIPDCVALLPSRTFPLCDQVPFFPTFLLFSYTGVCMLPNLVSPLFFFMREVFCAEYTPLAWDLRFLQSMLNDP